MFVAFLGRVAVYLLRTVESSGLLYAAGGNLNNDSKKYYYDIDFHVSNNLNQAHSFRPKISTCPLASSSSIIMSPTSRTWIVPL